MTSTFTVWRIHECNRDFNQWFLGDKKRLVFWLCAFFLIFWNKGAEPKTAMDSMMLVASSSGAFLILILTALVTNRLFGRDVELLTSWFLLLCPGFVLYARFGLLQPLCAGLTFALVLAVYIAPPFRWLRSFFFGLGCGVLALCSTLCAGILLPLTCAGFLRLNRRMEDQPPAAPVPVRVLFFLLGASVVVVPLFRCPGLEGADRLTFYDWWTIFALGFRQKNSQMELALLLSAIAPVFWTAVPALDAVHKYLTADRTNGGKLTNPLLAVVVGTLGGVMAFGMPVLMPVLAAVAAWCCISGADPRWRFVWDRLILRVWAVLTTQVFPVAGLLAPLWLKYVYYEPGMTVSDALVHLCYFRLPLAAVMVIALAVIAGVIRRKKGVNFAPRCPELDLIIPCFYCILLVLMP